jgi:hypothetical protein
MVYQLRHTSPVAKKPHRCDWCYGTIQPGEKYHRSVNLGDDGLYEWLACVACQDLCPIVWEWSYRPDEGLGEDSFAEWAHDHRDDPEHRLAALAYLARRGAADAWFAS